MKNRQSTGLTLIEVLIVLVLLVGILIAVFGVIKGSFDLYHVDQGRLGTTRNSRSTMDVLGSDIRQAGERLTADFPAVVISSDVSGNSILTLRKGFVSAPLPLCSILPTAGNPYLNAVSPSVVTFPNGTSNLPLACTTNLQNLTEWNTQIANGNTTVYVYDAVNKTGAFSVASSTTTNAVTKEQRLIMTPLPATTFNPTRALQTDPVKDIRLYLLEERKYSLVSGKLMLQENNKTAVAASPNVVSFRIIPYLKDASGTPVQATLPFPSGTRNWKNLAYLEVQLQVQETNSGKTVVRVLSERYTPRNSGSAD